MPCGLQAVMRGKCEFRASSPCADHGDGGVGWRGVHKGLPVRSECPQRTRRDAVAVKAGDGGITASPPMSTDSTS